MTNHWLLVGSDILSVVKWVMPLVGCSLCASTLNRDDFAAFFWFCMGIFVYILGVCLLAGVL